MHAIRHRLDLERVKEIAKALDDAGVDAIEVAHGDGLGGGSLTYGAGSHTSFEWISAAAEVIQNSVLTTLLLPGIGTLKQLKEAFELGVKSVRVATHCTEADVSQQYIEKAREWGMDVSGFLMMAHHAESQDLAAQAKLMESYGAHCVYVTDSAGALTVHGVTERIKAYRDLLNEETQIGIHAHQNLSLSVANSLAAVEEGAFRVDASLAGHGAGAGNTAIESFVAVAKRYDWAVKADLFKLLDAADDLVRPLHERAVQVDRETLSLGFAGVYSSFLRHAEKTGEKYGIDPRDILIEIGQRKLIGGQEDMIVDVALDLLNANKQAQL